MHHSTVFNNMTFIIHYHLTAFITINEHSTIVVIIQRHSSQVTHAVRGVTWAADQVPCQLVFYDDGWQYLPPQSIFQMSISHRYDMT